MQEERQNMNMILGILIKEVEQDDKIKISDSNVPNRYIRDQVLSEEEDDPDESMIIPFLRKVKKPQPSVKP